MRRIPVSLIIVGLAAAMPAMAAVVYNSLPIPNIPPNVASLGYECCQTAEFGQGVQMAGQAGILGASLTSATILMSDWALKSDWLTVGNATGFTVPLTLNLYGVGPGNAVGSLITTDTITALIKWRPEAIGAAFCASDLTAYKASDGLCYHGLAQTVTFNLNNIAVPGQFIWGLAFNTQSYGVTPTGVNGPYNSLNVGVNDENPIPTSIGSDLVADSAYWNTLTAGYYADNGVGGVGTFRLDQGGWKGQDPAAQFDGTVLPEPSLLALLGLFVVGLGVIRFKHRTQSA